MGAKKMSLKFRFKSCETLCFLRDSGSEFRTVGPKTEPKVSREKRGTVSNEVSRERSVLGGQVWMKKVRNIRWHTVLIDALKTETSSFVTES